MLVCLDFNEIKFLQYERIRNKSAVYKSAPGVFMSRGCFFKRYLHGVSFKRTSYAEVTSEAKKVLALLSDVFSPLCFNQYLENCDAFSSLSQ